MKPMPRALLLPTLVLFALSAFGLSACGELTEFENEFDTEFTIPKPEKGAFGFPPLPGALRRPSPVNGRGSQVGQLAPHAGGAALGQDKVPSLPAPAKDGMPALYPLPLAGEGRRD
jgi:hypothetical protein